MRIIETIISNKETFTIEEGLTLIQSYIKEKKGVHVPINLDLSNPKEVKLFEKAVTVASNYFKGSGYSFTMRF